MHVCINDVSLLALVDSGSSASFVSPAVVHKLGLTMLPSSERIAMASTPLVTSTLGHCEVGLKVQGERYDLFKLAVLPDLCTDLILGQDFMRLHESIQFETSGPRPALTVCGVAGMHLEPPSLFANLTPDCKPISTPTRHHSQPERAFIRDEVQNLLREGIVEKSALLGEHRS